MNCYDWQDFSRANYTWSVHRVLLKAYTNSWWVASVVGCRAAKQGDRAAAKLERRFIPSSAAARSTRARSTSGEKGYPTPFLPRPWPTSNVEHGYWKTPREKETRRASIDIGWQQLAPVPLLAACRPFARRQDCVCLYESLLWKILAAHVNGLLEGIFCFCGTVFPWRSCRHDRRKENISERFVNVQEGTEGRNAIPPGFEVVCIWHAVGHCHGEGYDLYHRLVPEVGVTVLKASQLLIHSE